MRGWGWMVLALAALVWSSGAPVLAEGEEAGLAPGEEAGLAPGEEAGLAPGEEAALAEGGLAAPVRIEAGGEPIDTATGHAAPFAHDWDGDGLWDLLVGQMGGGKLRIYKNVGTAQEPRFEIFETFQVGGTDATVPSG